MTYDTNNIFGRVLETVFLDRDGVLNEKKPEGCYVASRADFHVLPGVPEAIRSLNRAGLRVIVVSNQRGIARGLYTAADVEMIHSGFQETLKPYGAHIDRFYFCPHEKQECNCRKPLPGQFELAVMEFPGISAKASAIIGDSFSDLEFGRRLGMLTVFLDSHAESQTRDGEFAGDLADLCFHSLAEAVQHLLGERATKPMM